MIGLFRFVHNTNDNLNKNLCGECVEQLCEALKDKGEFYIYWHANYKPVGMVCREHCTHEKYHKPAKA